MKNDEPGLLDFQFQIRGVTFKEVHLTKILTLLLDRWEYATGEKMTPDDVVNLVGFLLSEIPPSHSRVMAAWHDYKLQRSG